MGMLNTLKTELVNALRSKSEMKKNLIRLIISEYDSVSFRQGAAKDEETENKRIYNIIRRIKESNDQSLKFIKDSIHPELYMDKFNQLTTENRFINTLLPSPLSKEKLIGYLSDVVDNIRTAKNEGIAKGIVYKQIKAKGLDGVDQETVMQAIQELRETCKMCG